MAAEAPSISGRLLLATMRSGPFISATSHTILQLGQRPPQVVEADVEDSEEFLTGGGGKAGGPASGGKASKSGSKARKSRAAAPGAALGKKGRGSMTLMDLIEAGTIVPGRNKITVVYKGITYTASLNRDGMIIYQGKKFQSATSFSIHCKRLQTPNKQGDDGWKSVLYEGQPLESYRKRFYAKGKVPVKRAPGSEADLDEEDYDMLEEPAPVEPAPAQEAEAHGTDQWVQCDRCRTWRIVPDKDWPGVQDDPRDHWWCEYATWDVTKLTPFAPPCQAG
ncbi:hypothetical protein WJX72_001520 [[Myrmecia] bisecta]|uniref:CW-type domain-containing protein n=1 Tax=[Myrmecia] bisecta TaxID=41462 RepID=A0AAW1PJA9_9CHLO